MPDRKMKCPYCRNVFDITEEQQSQNSTFCCPKCKRHNQGSVYADENGVLIGLKNLSDADLSALKAIIGKGNIQHEFDIEAIFNKVENGEC